MSDDPTDGMDDDARVLEARIVDLEMLVAHQQKTIDDLNEVVTGQGRMIADLRRKLETLTTRFLSVEEQLRDAPPVDKPPHW